MKRLTSVAIASVFVTVLAGVGACNNRAKLEACRLVEIEDAEFEVEFGDVDAERGEVEMVCGDDIVDVPWGEFRRKLQIDPGQYKNNLNGFEQQVSCMKDERSDNELFCNAPGSTSDFVAISFSYDD